jgi:hypothetical protein
MKINGVVRVLSRRVPSPAMVVACLALTVALAGTSYAAIRLPANSVGTVQLKRAAVIGAKVKKNSLTGTQIRESTLTIVPAALNADSADSADSAAVSRLDYQSATVSVPGGNTTAIRGTANCPQGLFATGGGAKMADPNTGFIADTNPVGKTGWEATGFANVGTQNMTVYVICAVAASTSP